MASLLRVSLENMAQRSNEELDVGDNLEADALMVENELQSVQRADERLEEVRGVMDSYREQIEATLDSGKEPTPELAETARRLVEAEANLVGGESPVSLESHADPRQQLQLALEFLKSDYANRYAQAWVVNWKSMADSVANLFTTTNHQLSKYEARVTAAEAEYNEKRHDWTQPKQRGSLVSLWQHFTTGAGESINVLDDMSFDSDVSKYLLMTYPGKVIDAMKQLAQAVKAAKFGSADDAAAFAKKVGSLAFAPMQFEAKYLGDHPLFGAVGLERVSGRTPAAVEIDGTEYKELATRATPMEIVQKTRFSHTWKLATHNGSNNLSASAIEFTNAQIGELFKGAKEYLEHVRGFVKLKPQYEQAQKALAEALVAAEATLGQIEDRAVRKTTEQVLGQVKRMAKTTLQNFARPATREVARSIKTCRYANYLGLRMIYNAK